MRKFFAVALLLMFVLVAGASAQESPVYSVPYLFTGNAQVDAMLHDLGWGVFLVYEGRVFFPGELTIDVDAQGLGEEWEGLINRPTVCGLPAEALVDYPLFPGVGSCQ